MNYLLNRLTPLIKDVSGKGKVCCDQLTEEMGLQAETIHEAAYKLKGLSKDDIACVEAFTHVYDKMCNSTIAVEMGEKNGFKAAAKAFEPRFNKYVNTLKKNIGDVKYALLSKKVEKNIKKPSSTESNFRVAIQPSLSYSAALRADSEPVSSQP